MLSVTQSEGDGSAKGEGKPNLKGSVGRLRQNCAE